VAIQTIQIGTYTYLVASQITKIVITRRSFGCYKQVRGQHRVHLGGNEVLQLEEEV